MAQAFLGASGAFAGIAAASIAVHPAAVIGGSVLALVGARLLGISVRGAPATSEQAPLDDRMPMPKRLP